MCQTHEKPMLPLPGRCSAACSPFQERSWEQCREKNSLEAAESVMMNGSDLASTTASSPKSKEDQVVNGHDEKENNPFAEYMWMENEEDFNRQVEEELQEQEFLDRCFQEMLEEEDQDWFIPSRDLPQGMGQLQQQLNGLSVGDSHTSEDILVRTF
ncbi:polyadenylate-binding protein-interacting protein 2B isoform 2-T2 [Podargus strigoides]